MFNLVLICWYIPLLSVAVGRMEQYTVWQLSWKPDIWAWCRHTVRQKIVTVMRATAEESIYLRTVKKNIRYDVSGIMLHDQRDWTDWTWTVQWTLSFPTCKSRNCKINFYNYEILNFYCTFNLIKLTINHISSFGDILWSCVKWHVTVILVMWHSFLHPVFCDIQATLRESQRSCNRCSYFIWHFVF